MLSYVLYDSNDNKDLLCLDSTTVHSSITTMPKATTKTVLSKRKESTAWSVCEWNDERKQRQVSLVNFFGKPTITTNANTKRATLSTSTTTTVGLLCVATNNNNATPLNPPKRTAAMTLQKRSINNNNTSNNKEKKRKSEQLYIDVGQASFGKRTECVHCGTLYVHGVAADSQAHERVCRDFTQGVFVRMTAALQASKDVVPVQNNNDKDTFIIEVMICDESVLPNLEMELAHQLKFHSFWFQQVKTTTPANTTLRRKAQDVQKIAEQDLGFVAANHEGTKNTRQTRPFHSFLYVVRQRVVGLLMTETISKAFLATDKTTQNGSPSISSCTGKAQKASLGIHLLWVKDNHRGKGIATSLVNVARERLVFGYTSIPAKQVAFSSPTESGMGFAQAYMKHHNVPVLVYEYEYVGNDEAPRPDKKESGKKDKQAGRT